MYDRRSFSPSRTFEYLITIVKRRGSFVRGMQNYPKQMRLTNTAVTARIKKRRALNSAVECHLHTVEVIGSNPIAPTIFTIAYEPLTDHTPYFQ